MKFAFVLFFGCLFGIVNGFSQDTLTIRYYKDIAKKKVAKPEKAKFIEYKIQDDFEVITYRFIRVEDKQLIRLKSYLDDYPVRLWQYYSASGKLVLENNYDIDFEFSNEVFNQEVYFDVRNAMSMEHINGVFIAPTLQGFGGIIPQFIYATQRYPQYAKQKRIQGKVIVHAKITASGKLEVLSVNEDADKILAVEAIRILRSSPRWQPASLNGRNIAVYAHFPVVFKLE